MQKLKIDLKLWKIMEKDDHSDDEIKQIFSLKNVAVVGMSKHPEKAAHFVPKYLLEQGFN